MSEWGNALVERRIRRALNSKQVIELTNDSNNIV